MVDGGLTKPAGAAGFQQIKCADDVRLNEIARAGDGTIHVGFRRQMHDVRDGMLLDDTQRGGFVAQIYFLENVFGMPGNFFQIREMPGVGEAIQIDELRNFRPVNDVVNQIRADKTRAAGDQQVHG